MKLVKSICWVIFNWDDLSYLLNSDFFLKNGTKIEAYDNPSIFTLEEKGPSYIFCEKCRIIFNQFLVCDIIEFFKDENHYFYDIEIREDFLWNLFIEWVRLESLQEKANIKESLKFE